MIQETSPRVSVGQLILMPAALTLAVTLLRLFGELRHWPAPWFNNGAGGGGAIVGISWLPFIFGPYFAVRLARMGSRPAGSLRTILMGLLGLAVVIGGAVLAFSPPPSLGRLAGGLLAIAVGTLLQFNPWADLARTLLAYAYAARIPVAIVMGFATRGSWGTHYDALPPGYTGPTTFWAEYLLIGLVPQLLFWVAFTVAAGALAGGIAAAVALRRPAPETAAGIRTQ